MLFWVVYIHSSLKDEQKWHLKFSLSQIRLTLFNTSKNSSHPWATEYAACSLETNAKLCLEIVPLIIIIVLTACLI